MKVTRLGRTRPAVSLATLASGTGGGAGTGLVSSGSNGGLEYRQIVYAISADGSPVNGPFVNLAAGSNITLTRDSGPGGSMPSNTIRIHSTGGGGSLTVADEGVDLSTSATKLDFVGAGVTASGSGATKTITIPGGGGGGGAETGGFAIMPLDRTTDSGMDGTFGDDFTGASLDAKWTRVNQTSGEESYQQGPRASALRVAYSTGSASRYIYQASPANDWTFECSLTILQPTSTGEMFGLLALNSSGTGVAVMLYDNSPGLYLANVTTGSYASALATRANPVSMHRAGQRLWLRLRKASGVYHGSYSHDGEVYTRELSGTPGAFTLARVGIGRFLGTTAGDTVDWHWFDKTA